MKGPEDMVSRSLKPFAIGWATIARAVIAGILVAALTVTPLSAVLAPGRFETRFRGTEWWDPGLLVVLEDRTGLVAGIAIARPGREDSVADPPGVDRVLVVTWLGGACDHWVSLLFERAESGYRLEERTYRAGFCIMIGVPRAVAIHLKAPVDAASVRLESATN